MFLLIASSSAFLLSLLARLPVEAYLSERISLISSFAGLEKTKNAGIAFGIDLPPNLLYALLPAALLLVVSLAWKDREKKSHSLCFGLIIGGALANIVDRFDDGYVTDFIQIGSFPYFNIADSCITIGVLLLLLFECRR